LVARDTPFHGVGYAKNLSRQAPVRYMDYATWHPLTDKQFNEIRARLQRAEDNAKAVEDKKKADAKAIEDRKKAAEQKKRADARAKRDDARNKVIDDAERCGIMELFASIHPDMVGEYRLIARAMKYINGDECGVSHLSKMDPEHIEGFMHAMLNPKSAGAPVVKNAWAKELHQKLQEIASARRRPPSRPASAERRPPSRPASAERRRPKSETRQLFEKLDTDGSGGLSASELKHAMERRLVPGRDEFRNIYKAMDAFDTNHDGEISYGEFKEMLAEIKEKIASKEEEICEVEVKIAHRRVHRRG